MKTILHFKLLLISILLISSSAKSQNDDIVYAITDSIPNGVKWNFLRTLDLRTGVYSDTILRLLSNEEMTVVGNPISCNGVAAIAHDKKNKRLYYTPMLSDKLNYVDLTTMQIFTLINNFSGLMPKAADQGNIFTRMVIADDEKGYALTNDGQHLVRFTTGNNALATDLGALIDAPGNAEMSVHNTWSSYGGDLIADNDGHLYLITSRNHVYRVSIQTRVAKYLGTVSGLPGNFLTSGVAVDRNGSESSLILVSSVDASDVYLFDLNTLVASGLSSSNTKHASDLSNGDILKTKKQSSPNLLVGRKVINDQIQLYPNPVTNDEFKIQFTNAEAGSYTITLIDASGQLIKTESISIGGKYNIITIDIPKKIARGIYTVRVVGRNNKAVFSEKIILQ